MDTRAKALKALAEVALQYNINLGCLDPEELTLLIINCKLYILKVIDTPRTRDLTELESATRRLCYELHCARRRYLSVGEAGCSRNPKSLAFFIHSRLCWYSYDRRKLSYNNNNMTHEWVIAGMTCMFIKIKGTCNSFVTL